MALKHLPISKVHIKRTIRPLYAYSQATPKSGQLDPAWDRSVDIWPGMAFMKTEGHNYTLLNATGVPAGLIAQYIGGDGLDELLQQNMNSLGVWVLGPDAEFEILAPAFDDTVAWTDPGDGTELLVHAYVDGAARGKLCPVGAVNADTDTVSTEPVARLISVEGPAKIIIGGLLTR